MSDLYKTLLISRPQVLSSGGSGLLTQDNNLSDVADVTTARNNLGAIDAAYVEPIAASRALASYGQSDGATSGRGIIHQDSDRTLLASVPAFEFVAEILFPATTASANRGILTVGNTSVNATTGGFALVSFGATLFFNLGTNGGQWQASGYVSSNAGLRKRLHVSIPCGTQNAPTVTDETGATVTLTQSIAPSGADTWLGDTLANRAFVVGSGWPAGEIPRVVPILGTLSTAEKTEYRTTGRLPAWVMAGGSAAFPNTVFATGLGGVMDSLTSATATGFSAAETTGGTSYVFSRLDGGFGLGNVVRLLFDATLTSGATPTLSLGNLGTNAELNISVVAGANVVTLTPTRFYNGFIFNTTGNTNYSVSNLRVQVAGALTAPAYQGTATVRDLTTLGGTQPNQGRLVGVRPILATPSPTNISIFPLSTTGAFLTLASTNPLAFTPQRIVRAEVIVDTAGADLTFRNNSSSTNDIVTALTDIPSANTATALTLIAAQTRLAPNATIWGSLSAGTGFLVVETADSL